MMAMAERWIETCRSLVHPWQCDSQGHLNTRYHAAVFDDASWQVLAAVGYRNSMAKDIDLGWADVRHTTEFHREAPVGAFLLVESRIQKIGNTSFTIAHRMLDLEDSMMVASFEGVTVAFDLQKRKSRPLPAAIRDEAVRMFT